LSFDNNCLSLAKLYWPLQLGKVAFWWNNVI
jgi:hypothetical protein